MQPLFVTNIANQLLGAVWSYMFRKSQRLDSGPAGKSVWKDYGGKEQGYYKYLVFAVPRI